MSYSAFFRAAVAFGIWCTAVSSAPLLAQQTGPGILVKVNGDATVTADDPQDIVVVVRGNARVAGSVDAVVIVDGTLVLEHAIVGHIVAVRATIEAGPGSRVTDEIQLIDSELAADPSAQIDAEIHQGIDWGSGAVVFGVLIGIGFSIAVIVAGLVLAGIAPSLMRETGAAITGRIGPTLLSALILWVVLPVSALFLVFTLVGTPTAIGMLLALPLIWFGGYLVSGICLGDFLMRRLTGAVEPVHPYRAAALGLVALLMAGWVPFIGSIVSPVAGFLGSGALALTAWQRFLVGRTNR